MKRICYHFLGFLAGCLVLYIAFITSFEAVCYWTPGYYQKEFEKYNVLSSMEYWTGDYMEMDNLTEVMHQTMKYLRGNRQNLIVETDINGTTQEFYNDSEKSHMADVRDLFVLNIFWRSVAGLTFLAIAGFLIFMLHGRGALYFLGSGYIAACSFALVLVVVIGIAAVIDFTKVFTIFHEIFFAKQGNWLFDPRESRMINMLPEGFFSDTILRITEIFIGALIAFLAAAIFMVRWTKKAAERFC